MPPLADLQWYQPSSWWLWFDLQPDCCMSDEYCDGLGRRRTDGTTSILLVMTMQVGSQLRSKNFLLKLVIRLVLIWQSSITCYRCILIILISPRVSQHRRNITIDAMRSVLIATRSAQVDNSGLRFFVTENLRPNDLGVLTFGTGAGPESLAIPPGVSKFVVDSYCPAFASQVGSWLMSKMNGRKGDNSCVHLFVRRIEISFDWFNDHQRLSAYSSPR